MSIRIQLLSWDLDHIEILKLCIHYTQTIPLFENDSFTRPIPYSYLIQFNMSTHILTLEVELGFSIGNIMIGL